MPALRVGVVDEAGQRVPRARLGLASIWELAHARHRRGH